MVVLELDLFVIARHRENFIEHRLQAHAFTLFRADFRLEKIVVRVHLYFNQVGWSYDFLDIAEVDAAVHFIGHRLCRGFVGSGRSPGDSWAHQFG